MVKLFCAIVGVVGSVFEVEIDADQLVGDLKKAIKGEKPNDLKDIDADKLQLFLAKKDEGRGAWLTEADVKKADGLTPLDAGGAPLNLVGLSKKDVKFQVTRQHVMAKTTPVHVLVVVPKQENDRSTAMALGVAPSLPPTTIHRHPERLKRWAAINAMIRQKNQEANQKTTNEDAKKTNKKRKNHDVDKTVGYSSLCWQDIKPIYNFDVSYDLQPSDIPDADIQLLLARIKDLRRLYGQMSDGKEAKRLFFIAPILETVSRQLGDVRILVEEDVDGKNVLLKGRFEFVLQRGTKRISLVQAKREDMLQGLVQNVTGLEALADVEDLSVVYGIVTNFLEWKFLISEDERVRQQECTLPLTDTIPTFEGLKEIVGKIYAMLQ
ncbi:Crinkler effector protein 5 [Phytophthora ramorum]|uniref:Crinkler effector protein 5 n=1 Tax=Phytophthora ramorum TaxID=164328 RepID=UPI0030A65060|nr:Crinkler effector protein 5 [Phytophthora ramorum]